MSKPPRVQRGLRWFVDDPVAVFQQVLEADQQRRLRDGFNTDFSFRTTITEIARKGPFSLPNLGGFFYQQRHRKEIVCATHCAKEFLPKFNPMVTKPAWNPDGELGRMTPGLRASYVTRDETVHDLRDLDWLETLRLVQNREWEDAHAHMRVDLFPPPASLKLSWQAAGHQLSLHDFASDMPLERKIMEAGEDVCRRLAGQAHRSGKSVALGGAMHEAFSTANWYRNHLPMFQLRPYQQPLVDFFAGKK